jgi:cell division septum initiation protein DivIVA
MAIDLTPRFTVSLRGYDKDEVERYLAGVSDRATQAEEQLYELQEQTRYLEEEHDRLVTRVEELEAAIRSETPHTVGALGERITLILNEAEEGASETLTQAKAEAEYLVSVAEEEAETLRRQSAMSAAQAAEALAAAQQEAVETITAADQHAAETIAAADQHAAETVATADRRAAEALVTGQRKADELAQRLEAEARAEAAAILRDTEDRAERRQAQIEVWAQEMIAHTQAEQARLTDEFALIRRGHEAEVRSLVGDRDDAMAAIRSLQASLVRAVEAVADGRLREVDVSDDAVAEATSTSDGARGPGNPAVGVSASSAAPSQAADGRAARSGDAASKVPGSGAGGSAATASIHGASNAGTAATAQPEAARIHFLYDGEHDAPAG